MAADIGLLRICFTAEEFFPIPSGRLRRIYEVAKRLASRNEVHIYCQRYQGTPKESIMDRIHVHRVGFPFRKPTSYLMRASSTLPLLLSILNEERFDIINTNWLFPPAPSYLAAKLKRTPIVFTSDGILWHHLGKLNLPDYNPLLSLFGCIMEDIDVRCNYNAYITVSHGTRDELISMGINPEKIFVVYNGVDLGFYDSIKVRESEKPSVCYVGHLEGRKNILDLIQAFQIVLGEVPDTTLTVAGTGPLLRRAEELAKALKISDRVIFMGSVGFEEAAKIIKSSHLLVLPSLVEGFGIVLAEANACHKPVVAYDIPNVREVVKDGVNGFLVEPRNVKKLAKRIIEVLRDDTLRRRMGEDGRRIVEKHFTWDGAAEETLEVYHKVLKET